MLHPRAASGAETPSHLALILQANDDIRKALR